MNVRESLSALHRNLVVSYDEGERLGHVTNVYFDKPSCRIKGVSLSRRLIKSEKETFVAFEGIHRLGKSVLIISTKAALKNIPKGLDTSSLRALKGTKVVTRDGEHLGELLDVNVVAKTGIISELVLYGARKLKIDVEKDKISFGPDMLIVPANYSSRIQEMEVSNQKRFVTNAGKTTRNVTESIKSAVLNVTAKKQQVKEATAKQVKKPVPVESKSTKPISEVKSKPSPLPTKKQVAKKTIATPSKKLPTKKTTKKVAAKKTTAKKKAVRK